VAEKIDVKGELYDSGQAGFSRFMVQIVTVSSKDYDELSVYLSSFEDEPRSQDYWMDRLRLWWDLNPAFSEEICRGWILRDRGQIVGFLGTIPSKFLVLGKEITVFTSTTWRVLKEYRNESLSLLFQQIHLSNDSILFGTTPAEGTVKMFEKLRFQLIPKRSTRRAMLLINEDKFLRSPLRQLLTKNSLGKRFKKLKKSKFCVNRLEKADASFDELWKRTQDKCETTNVRTVEVINWYCFESSYFKKILFGCHEGNRLLAFMICKKIKKQNLKILECHDLWGDLEEESVMEALVEHARKFAKQHSYDLVQFPYFSDKVESHLKGYGLCELEDAEQAEYFKVPANTLTKMSMENSYFTLFQGDNGL